MSTNHARDVAERVAAAHRDSVLSEWRAAAQAGLDVRVVHDGSVALGAAPDLPGHAFNSALGITGKADEIARAVAFFADHNVDGFVALDSAVESPGPGTHLGVFAAAPSAVPLDSGHRTLAVRAIEASERSRWADTMIVASAMQSPLAEAWHALTPHLPPAPRRTLWLAEESGDAVGTGSLHVVSGTGWLSLASVVPIARGRGSQRALLAARAEAARMAGCDLVAASALLGGASHRNLTRSGFELIAGLVVRRAADLA